MSIVTVRHLMSSPVITFFAEQSLALVEDVMRLRHVRHIPVIDDAQHVIGLVSHRDLMRLSHDGIDVRALMREDVRTIDAEASAASAGGYMLEHNIGCLPVVNGAQQLIGIITERDFLRFAVRDLQLHS